MLSQISQTVAQSNPLKDCLASGKDFKDCSVDNFIFPDLKQRVEDTYYKMTSMSGHRHAIEVDFSETLQAFKPTFERESKAISKSVNWVKGHSPQVDFDMTDLQTAIDKILQHGKAKEQPAKKSLVFESAPAAHDNAEVEEADQEP